MSRRIRTDLPWAFALLGWMAVGSVVALVVWGIGQAVSEILPLWSHARAVAMVHGAGPWEHLDWERFSFRVWSRILGADAIGWTILVVLGGALLGVLLHVALRGEAGRAGAGKDA